MSQLNKQNKFANVKPLITLCLALIMLSGCSTTSAPIVINNDSFCDSKYQSIATRRLNKKDLDNINAIRKDENHRTTIDKFIDNITVNEKEFKACPTNGESND